jgi:glutamate carboxypeptidase
VSDGLSREARAIAVRLPSELEALVAVSSPWGDTEGAERAVAVARRLLPAAAQVERLPCSSPGNAPDLLARVDGTGERAVLLLGHLDTVVAHARHDALHRDDGRLVGSGAIDMKGGVALAAGVLRALAAAPERFAQLALLLVCDEEWRQVDMHHARRFAGFDGCLCFEAGQLGPEGEEAVVVRRKAAGTLRVAASGRSAHSGSAPERGRNALLALAEAARRVADRHDPSGAQQLTAVPTVLHSGDAFNVVPAAGELLCDLRASSLDAFDAVLAALPEELDGAHLRGELVRRWPAMDSTTAAAPALRRAATALGAPLHAGRGGASDASYLARIVPATIDGLGPRGGLAHAPGEYVSVSSIEPRAHVALALARALLA